MVRQVLTALSLTLLLWAAIATAATYDRSSSCAPSSEGACVTFTSADSTNDLAVIALGSGRTYTMIFDPDVLTTGVPADGAGIFLRRSLTCLVSDTSSYRVLVDQDGDGTPDDVEMDGTSTDDDQRAAIYGLPGGCYFVEIATAAASGDVAMVSFEAN